MMVSLRPAPVTRMVCLLVLFHSLATIAAAQYAGYDYGFDAHQLVKRHSQQKYVVRRLEQRDSRPPVRQEIRQLEKDTKMWTLYLLALSMMQFIDQSDMLSWYQITGIHGIPFQTWSGVGPTPGNERSGYCTHISVLFPTWHRPYLSLYENLLFSLVQEIASFFPDGDDKQGYRDAANNFRIPYWDWAMNPPAGESVLPQSIGGSPSVDINGPNGLQRIANPLFTYQFKPLNSTAFILAPWNFWQTTVRAPTSNDTSAKSNNTWIAQTLDQNLPSFQQRLYTLFSNYANYSTWSNAAWIPDPHNSSYDSIESLHDTIHNIAGGMTGHMAYIPFSAFDPIFFLHHAMVDRIFAMWQVLYPNSWITPTPAATNSYTTSKGDIQDSNTALTPFYAHSNGTFWTSDMIRDISVLGYSYPETSGLSSASGSSRAYAKAQSRVRIAINKLYGSSSPARHFLSAPNVRNSQVRDLIDLPRTGIVNHRRYHEWIANIRVRKQALAGPFSIYLFLGHIPENPKSWPISGASAGTMSVFASPDSQEHGGHNNMISGTVPLTAALAKQVADGALSGIDPAVAGMFLRKHLKFAILGHDGVAILEGKEVDGLHIHVTSSEVEVPSGSDELLAWGQATTHFELI